MDNTAKQQTMIGEVQHVSDKTARVKVGRTTMHPIYRKRYSVHSTILAHIPTGVEVETGATVTVQRTRPVSKHKHWTVVKPS